MKLQDKIVMLRKKNGWSQEEFAEKIIPENDSVRLYDDIIDEMNLYSLFHTYSDRGRKYATNPRTLLKILVYANMQGIYSSRDIETACNRDINFMWLLNGEKAPNHFEIARFRSKRLSQCKDEIFYQLVNKLAECAIPEKIDSKKPQKTE